MNPFDASRPAPRDSKEDDGVDVGAIWAMFRRQAHWVVVAVVGSVAVAETYCQFAAPTYQAEAELLIKKKTASMARVDASDQSSVADEILSTHIEILRSHRVVADALAQDGLAKRPSLLASLPPGDDLVGHVIDHLTVGKGGEGSGRSAQVVRVRFRHASPRDCRDFLTALVSSYQSFLHETSQQPMQEALDLVSHKRDDLATELAQLKQEFHQFRLEAPNLWDGDDSLKTPQANMQRLSEKITQVRAEKIDVEAKLTGVRDGLRGKTLANLTYVELIGLIDDQYLEPVRLLLSVRKPTEHQTATARMLELKTELIRMRLTYGEDHPRTRQTVLSIEETERFLETRRAATAEANPESIVRAYVTSLKSSLSALGSREEKLEALLAEEKRNARALEGVNLQNQNLMTAVSRAQQQYDAAEKQFEDIQLARDYEGFVTKVISPVTLGQQVAPRKGLVLAMGCCLGLLLGAAIAVFVDQHRQRFVDVQEIQETTGLPVLASLEIPARQRAKQSVELDSALVTHHHPSARASEQFRCLRHTVMHAGRDLQLIQVTGIGGDTAKSIVAANLAISLARAGKSVLLLDADLRQPAQASLFSSSVVTGLAARLTDPGIGPLAYQRTAVENLWLLPARKSDADTLLQRELPNLLEAASEDFEYVILDSPALPQTFDAVELADHVDGVILAMDRRQVRCEETLSACRMLWPCRGKVLGMVDGHGTGRLTRLIQHFGWRLSSVHPPVAPSTFVLDRNRSPSTSASKPQFS